VSLEPKAAQPLQFDTAVPSAPRADAASAEGVTCAVCQRTITDRYFDVNGQSTCNSCRQQIAQQAETPKGFGVFARAALFGVGAAIAGAVLYYAVIAITDFEIGLVAIVIGYMVGYAVRSATGNRGGLRFQVLALLLTYWAVGLAYTPFLFTGDTQSQEAQIAPASTEPVSTEPASPESGETEPAPLAQSLDPVGVAIASALLLALSLALPVLTVFSSLPSGLISAAIIAFGMQQAWRMTGAPQVVISGPYRIARPAKSA
jgi:hypothetical protein